MRRIALLVLIAAGSLFAFDANEDLLAASRTGDLSAIQAALEKGATIETKTAYGQTPLYLAAMSGHEEVVRFLLDKGAAVDVTDTFYKAPMISFVLQRKHYGVAKMLIARSKSNPDQMLGTVAGAGKADLVQAVLESGKPSQTALNQAYESALERKQTETAEALKKAGAQEPAPPVAVDPKVLASYEGSFKSAQIPIEIKVFVKGSQLYAQAAGQSEFAPKARSATRFEFVPAQLAIEFDSADSFTLRQGGQAFKFTRVVVK